MLGRNSQYYSLFLLLVDASVLVLALLLSYALRVGYDDRPLVTEVGRTDYFLSLLSILPFWIATFALLGLYSPSTYNRRLSEWGKIAAGSFVGVLLILGWEFVTGESILPARLVAVYALVGSFGLIILERESLRWLRNTLFRYGIGTSRVLLVGSSSALRPSCQPGRY